MMNNSKESKSEMLDKKVIMINEGQLSEIKNHDIEAVSFENMLSEAFAPNAQQVVIIKKYLDSNFRRTFIDDIDEFAKPIKRPAITRLIMGQEVETIEGSELVDILAEKFPNMIGNKEDAKKFMTQIVKDWFDKKISDNGILSVNFL